MQITILCSNENHPISPYLKQWAIDHDEHEVEIISSRKQLTGGDFLFLISCAEILNNSDKRNYKHCLVIHASDLPHGRGWSPHIWSLLNGSQEIVITLLEAEDLVDSGRIWKKITRFIPQHALWDEINKTLFEAEIELMDYALENHLTVVPVTQDTSAEITYHAKRTPKHSQIDPHKSIESQFNQIRVCDPLRFPAFFELFGIKFKITLEKIDKD